MIWKKFPDIDQLNAMSKNTLLSNLGIEIDGITEDTLSGRMPVDHRTIQPFGYLHGGASVAFAETLGSIAANLCIEEQQSCFGLDINANHIKAVRSGSVCGKATAVHLGKSTQVWQIDIFNEDQELVCVCRLTMAIKN